MRRVATKRYVWDEKQKKLVFKGIVKTHGYGGNSYQVGDLPDIQRDIAANKAIKQKVDKQDRLEKVIRAYEVHS